MTYPMHTSSIPVFRQMLGALKDVLAKTEAHATARKIEPDALLQARLYPDMFPGPLGHSMAGRALESGTWACAPVQIRDFATDKHRTVDDTPAGGGAGMVLKADVLGAAIDHALQRLQPGDLCLVLVDQVEEALAHLAQRVREG